MDEEVTFERRRYGAKSFFTWAYIVINGERVSLGDPWPSVHVPKKELAEAIERAWAKHRDDDPHCTCNDCIAHHAQSLD